MDLARIEVLNSSLTQRGTSRHVYLRAFTSKLMRFKSVGAFVDIFGIFVGDFEPFPG